MVVVDVYASDRHMAQSLVLWTGWLIMTLKHCFVRLMGTCMIEGTAEPFYMSEKLI